jgi:fucose permease
LKESGVETFRRDGLTWLAYCLLSTFGYFLNVLGPITPFLRSELKLSYSLGGLHFTAFAAGLLVVGLFGYGLLRKLGPRASLWTGAFGMSSGVLILVLGQNPVVTIAATFVMGLSGSMILALVPSLLSARHGPLRTVALTEANLLSALIAAAAPLVIGLFAFLTLGWRWALGSSALAPFLLFVLFRKVELPHDEEEGGPNSQAKRPLPPLYWVYWTVLFLSVSIEFCMVYWSADFVVVTLGLSKENAAQAVSLFLGGMILGRFVAIRLVTRFPVRRVIVVSAAVAAVGFGFYWFTAAAAAVLPGLFLIGLGVSSLYPLVLSLSMEAAGGQSIKAGSRASLASGSAILCLPFLLGGLADLFGIHLAYLVVPVLLAGVVIVLLLGTLAT